MIKLSFGVMTDETGASRLRLEPQVAMRDDADDLRPSTTGTPEMFFARVSSITSRMVMSGRDGDRIVDDAAFELLDLVDLAGLIVDATCSCG